LLGTCHRGAGTHWQATVPLHPLGERHIEAGSAGGRLSTAMLPNEISM
jgi:hypothetical protein